MSRTGLELREREEGPVLSCLQRQAELRQSELQYKQNMGQFKVIWTKDLTFDNTESIQQVVLNRLVLSHDNQNVCLASLE